MNDDVGVMRPGSSSVAFVKAAFNIGFRIVLPLCTISCGTYRPTGTGEYRGIGDFRYPSDYHHLIGRSGTSKPSLYQPRADFELSWPLKHVKINRGFMAGRTPHDGLDLAGAKGTPILAAHSGYVVYSGSEFNGYGRMILLEFNDEWATLYAHMSKLFVRNGDIVERGQVIGEMGRTGRASGVHLHFELLRNRMPIDPLKGPLPPR